jgi:hypothetical protein
MQASSLDLGFILGTLVIGCRLFVSYRPSITPVLWIFWVGELAATGQAGLAIAGLVGLALTGLFTFLQPPRQVVQYGPWAGRNAPMLSRWQLAGLPGNAQVIDGRGLIFEVREMKRYRPNYLHPNRIFHTILSHFEPKTPPPLIARPSGPQMALRKLSVEWPIVARALVYTGAVSVLACLGSWFVFGHATLAVLTILLLACACAVLALLLSLLGLILEDALYEDRDDEDGYPYYA